MKTGLGLITAAGLAAAILSAPHALALHKHLRLAEGLERHPGG